MAVDKLVDSTQLDSDLTSVANAIRTRGGTTASLTFPAEFVSAVNAIPSGGGGEEAPFNDVNFYDYDGTIVASYTKTEFLALNALPNNPIHAGLVAQGWNWTLQNAKAYVTKYGILDIGQMYKPASGKTEIDIRLTDPEYLSPYLCICPNGTCTIDWGDGSNPEDVTGTSVTSVKYYGHQYPTTGKYTITISGVFGLNAQNAASSPLSVVPQGSRYRQYVASIVAIRLNDLVSINNYAFSGCCECTSIIIPRGIEIIGRYSLTDCSKCKHITIPDTVQSVNSNAFNKMFSLQSISIPASVVDIESSAFSSTCLARCCIPDGITTLKQSLFNTSQLRNVVIPDSVTEFESSVFNNNNNLLAVTVPSSVNTIAQSVFYYCYSVKEYHFLSATPPTLANSNLFNGILADTIIYVPRGSLSAYQTATNWSVYASYMQEEAA